MVVPYRTIPGFCPAYHMNKDRWITILPDGSSEKKDITALLAMSYTMTATKVRMVKRVPDSFEYISTHEKGGATWKTLLGKTLRNLVSE